MADKSLIVFFPIRVIPGGSPVLAITANGNSLEFPEMASWEDAIFHIDVTAIGGTPTLTFTIQERDEVSGAWVNLSPTPAITAISGTGHQRVVLGRSVGLPFGQRLRLAWTISGGSPSVTVTVVAEVINPTVVAND